MQRPGSPRSADCAAACCRLPYAARQTFPLKTESLVQVSEKGLAAVRKDQTEHTWEFPSLTINLKTNSTYLILESHREIHATHSRSFSTFS